MWSKYIKDIYICIFFVASLRLDWVNEKLIIIIIIIIINKLLLWIN